MVTAAGVKVNESEPREVDSTYADRNSKSGTWPREIVGQSPNNHNTDEGISMLIMR